MPLVLNIRDKEIIAFPGDSIDLKKDGIIVWFAEPEAEAYRIFQREHARRVNETIDYIKKENSNESRSIQERD